MRQNEPFGHDTPQLVCWVKPKHCTSPQTRHLPPEAWGGGQSDVKRPQPPAPRPVETRNLTPKELQRPGAVLQVEENSGGLEGQGCLLRILGPQHPAF